VLDGRLRAAVDGDQAPFVRPENSKMEHRRSAECALYLTGNSQLSYKRTELFPHNLPVI